MIFDLENETRGLNIRSCTQPQNSFQNSSQASALSQDSQHVEPLT